MLTNLDESVKEASVQNGYALHPSSQHLVDGGSASVTDKIIVHRMNNNLATHKVQNNTVKSSATNAAAPRIQGNENVTVARKTLQ